MSAFDIVLFVADQEVGRHRLGPGDHIAGSAPGCAIPIPNDETPRKYARVCISPNARVIVEDMGSEVGTMLDNLPIVVAGWSPGHVLRFRDVRLELWPVADERPPELGRKAAASEAPAAPLPLPEADEDRVYAGPRPARGTGPSGASPVTPGHTPGSSKRRGARFRSPLAMAGLVALLLAGAAAFFMLRRMPTGETTTTASAEAQSSYLQALQEIEDADFGDALIQIDAAIATQPGIANYYVLKGNILESLGRFSDAKDVYEQALQRDAGHGQARANRDLCQEIEQAGGVLTSESQAKLVALMRSQRRGSEAKALESRSLK